MQNAFLPNYFLIALGCFALAFFNFGGLANAQDLFAAPQEYNKAEVAEDLQVVWDCIQSLHPDPYWNTDSTLLHQQFLQTMQNLPDSMTLYAAHGVLATFVAALQDGHAVVGFNDRQVAQIFYEKNLFPYAVRIVGDSLFVKKCRLAKAELPVGTMVLSINGIKSEQILRELHAMIPSDASTSAAKSDFLEDYFAIYYGVLYGFPKLYGLVYQSPDELGKQIITVNAYNIIQHWNQTRVSNDPDFFSRLPVQYRKNGNVGILTVSSFSGVSKKRFKKLLNACFLKIRKDNISELVVDVRENGGGREGFDNLLLSHLDYNRPFTKYADVKLKSFEPPNWKYVKHSGSEKLKNLFIRGFEFRKKSDGYWHRRRRFNRLLKTRGAVFYGKVYILTSGKTFSCGSDFVSMAKHSIPGVSIIGNVTRGGEKGNCSGYFYEIVLPHTRFVFELPRIYFTLNLPQNIPDGGVAPDFVVTSNQSDIANGIDTQLNFVFDLINQRPYSNQ